MTVPHSAPTPAARNRWISTALVVLAVAPFIATLAIGFMYDDTTIIRTNPRIHGWSSLLTLWTEPYWGPDGGSVSGLYRPFYMAIMATVWNATNHMPIWFHLLVVVLHALATLLVFRLLKRGVSVGAAGIAAAWFAVHPVHVEAIASIANSSEIVVTLLTGLLALLLARSATGEEESTWRSAALASLVYLAACLTKESGFVAPAVAACFAWGWRPAAGAPVGLVDALRRWRPQIIACGVSLIAVIVVRVAVLGAFVPATIVAPGLDELSPTQRLWAMLSLWPHVGRLLLWPAELNPHYGPSYIAGRGGPTLSAALTLVVMVVALWVCVRRARRGDRRPLAAVSWMLIAFLPASNLLSATGQILAERTLYGASVGVAMLIALTADAVLLRAAAGGGRGHRADRALVGAAALLMVIVLAQRTSRAVRPWRSHAALFQQMIVADSASYRGRWLLGLDARSRGDTATALEWLGQAYARYPRDRQLLIDYSETLMRHDQPRQAAAVARGLMDWPELRRRPEAVALYLNALARGYGTDSALATSRWLRVH
jgi:hypothetical protein